MRHTASLLFSAAFAPLALADVKITEKPDRVTIEVAGSLFTEYRHGDAPHVYYWPIIGPGGVKMTRSYPMEKAEGEETDHVHHRSLWFAHGEVNGVDFWGEPASYKGTPKHPVGRIEHDGIVKAEGGKDSGVLIAKQKWLAPDGAVQLRTVQTLRVYESMPGERLCDFEIELIAPEKDVVFGDTKEGTAALRIAESMRVKRGKEGKGVMMNSEGVEGAGLWGKHARWVTMSGPIGDRTYSITFMDHPSNFRHPTRWHARDYGLFAANPFCEYDMDKSKAKGSGAYTLKAGEKLTLKYRILFAEGGPDQAGIEAAWKTWAGK